MISPETTPSTSNRYLALELIDGEKPKDSTGMVDPRLFKDGGNKLVASMNTESCLWTMRYEKGAIPPALQGSFTGFGALKKHADAYFFQRNLKVTEVH